MAKNIIKVKMKYPFCCVPDLEPEFRIAVFTCTPSLSALAFVQARSTRCMSATAKINHLRADVMYKRYTIASNNTNWIFGANAIVFVRFQHPHASRIRIYFILFCDEFLQYTSNVISLLLLSLLWLLLLCRCVLGTMEAIVCIYA